MWEVEPQMDYASKWKNRIAALEFQYKNDSSVWIKKGIWNKGFTRRITLENFRADNPYVWQKRAYSDIDYLFTYYQVKQWDKFNILHCLTEKGDFGVETVYSEEDKRLISRDILDSTLEINFLLDHIGASKLRVLDIGAGYGRLAKRLIESGRADFVACVDAIPISTALSEFYLSQELLSGQVLVKELTKVETLTNLSFDVALNIHSFPEMSKEYIWFWAKFIARCNISKVFIVPNGRELKTNNGEDFSWVFEQLGYSITQVRQKYVNKDADTKGLYPVNYFLLERA